MLMMIGNDASICNNYHMINIRKTVILSNYNSEKINNMSAYELMDIYNSPLILGVNTMSIYKSRICRLNQSLEE